MMTIDPTSNSATPKPGIAEWKKMVAQYQEPSIWRAAWQIVDSFVP